MQIDHGNTKVYVVSVPGLLTDLYIPQNMTINLSKEVYYGKSISSAAIASQEEKTSSALRVISRAEPNGVATRYKPDFNFSLW